MSTATATTQFEVGQTYSCRSICDYNCIWSFEVIKRTAKFISIKGSDNKVSRVGVKTWDGVERAYPLGQFSMAPSIVADDARTLLPDWMTA
jgi:hypothetical protein